MNISDIAFQIETQIPLREEEVHLWRVDLSAVAQGEERWKQMLSPDEQERATRFHFSRDRQHFTATRALLRMILGSYLESDPTKLVFRYSDKEKPSLDPAAHRPLVDFNVSHSGTTALLAFSRGRTLGVDLEQLRDNFDHQAIARRFFSTREQSQLAELAPAERCAAFFRCWTRKEAYIKAQGTGLSLPLSQFDVSLKPGETNGLVSTRPDRSEAAHWSLREVPAGEGYVAALCVQGHGWYLKD
jgi:4'-phosphopantetheinyl transferase